MPADVFRGTFSVNVSIVDDSILEGSEMFTLSLVLVDRGTPNTEVTITDDKAVVTIIDNDVKVQFVHEIVNVTEGDETLTVCLEKVGITTTIAVVQVTSCGHDTSLKTATHEGSGVDYDSVDLEVSFAPRDTVKCIDISVIDDQVMEVLEVFGVCVETVTTNVDIGDKDHVTVIIIDDDRE